MGAAGERRFRVTDENGKALYGLVYEENQSWASASDQYVHSKLFEEMPLYPPYLTYDEKKRESLCLDLFKDYDSVWFERASEYSAVKFYRKCDFEYSEVAQNRYNYEIMYGNRPITKRMYKLIIPIEY